MNGVPIVFGRWLFQELRVIWEKVWQDASNFQLNNTPDSVVWNLEKGGRFTVELLYDGLTRNESGVCHKRIWKGKFLQKINFFMAYVLWCCSYKRQFVQKGSGKVILLVFSVIVRKIFPICFSSVQLQE
jgi:hypothetical protein